MTSLDYEIVFSTRISNILGPTKLTLRQIRPWKRSARKPPLSMLTCYDYPTAAVLNKTELDLILVGDSLGNVILGLGSTIPVTLEHMILFTQAVKRGAPNKFIVADVPFGYFASQETAQLACFELFQKTQAEAIKIEGASEFHLQLIRDLTNKGIPVMGHIGLMPQSVNQQGGFFTHGKTDPEKSRLLEEARQLEAHGAFAIVLECVTADVANDITKALSIPTIGIGSGDATDGQVLVLHDLVGLNPEGVPRFVRPVANLKENLNLAVSTYLADLKVTPNTQHLHIEKGLA